MKLCTQTHDTENLHKIFFLQKILQTKTADRVEKLSP